jgi:CIC family chloride channel protein
LVDALNRRWGGKGMPSSMKQNQKEKAMGVRDTIVEDLRAAFRGLSLGKEQRALAVQAVIIGIVVWIAIFALKESVHWFFHEVLHWIDHAPTPWVLFIPLALAAIIMGLIAQYRSEVINFRDEEGEIEELNLVEGDGIERAIALYFSADPSVRKGAPTDQTGLEARWQRSTIAMAFRKFVASLVTLGSGGSGGLEASAALIGENLGAWYYKLRSGKAPSKPERLPRSMERPWLAPNPDYLQTAQLSGIAAAVTVLLGAPLSAAFFASEVMYRNRPLLEKLFYSLIAALTAQVMSSFVAGASPMMFGVEDISHPPAHNLHYWLWVVLLGIVIAFVGQLYRILNVQFHTWFQQGIKDRFVRLLVGFGITGAIALGVYYVTRWLGTTDRGLELVLGSGESMVIGAFAGQVTLSMALIGLVAKMVATLSTINSGGSAGLLVPSFFFGTMVAAAFAQLTPFEPVHFIVPALTGSLIAIVNTPFAALLFVVEEFGAEYLLPALVVLIITGLLSNPKTIYRAQQVALDSLELVPGYDISLLGVPAAWVGKKLKDLRLPERFEVQVVGLLDRSAGEEQPRVLFGSEQAAEATLDAEDTILVYGQEEKLDTLETTTTES